MKSIYNQKMPHLWAHHCAVPTVVQRSLVGPVGSLLHIFEVGMLLTQPSVKNSNPHISTLSQKESKHHLV